MSEAPDWIRAKAAGAIHPGQVERTLTRLAEQWKTGGSDLRELLEQFPLGEGALLHLLSVSSICAARLVREPEILTWLQHPDVCTSGRGRGRMLADLKASTTDSISAQNFRALRVWKGREMLRIALREVAEVASLE